MNYNERARAFMNAYEAAARQFRVMVTSCGCCGGPDLMDADFEAEDYLDENITHLRREGDGK